MSSSGEGKEASTPEGQHCGLPVWRSSIVSNGEADLTGVAFYPYADEEADPIFAVVGIGLISILQYEHHRSSGKGTIKPLYQYKDKARKSGGIWKEEKLHDEIIDQENIGQQDKHRQSRCIAWALRDDDGLPLLCVTGSGAIAPIAESKREEQVKRENNPDYRPTIKINTIIKVINPFTGERIQSLYGHGKAITALASSPTHPHILASASEDKNIFLWSLAKAHTKAPCVAVIGGWGHIDRILCLAWHSSGHWLLSGGFDNRVCLWHIPDYPDPCKPCGEWLPSVVDVPYFASSEVHYHPVERVAFWGDTIISYGATEPCVTHWRIEGFSSSTPVQLLPTLPTLHDEDARTRSGWAFAGMKGPLYRRLQHFDLPAKTYETLEDKDVWHVNRSHVDFDICVPQQRIGHRGAKSKGHKHAALAVCKGYEVRIWDFKRLITWGEECKKLKEGEKLQLPWLVEEKVVREEDEMDLDEAEAEKLLGLLAAQKKRSIASASTPAMSTPSKSRRAQKISARKTGAPSSGGLASEPANSPQNLRRMLFDPKTGRSSTTAKKTVNSTRTLPRISGYKDISEIAGLGEEAASSRLAEEAALRRPKKVSDMSEKSRLPVENLGGGDDEGRSDVVSGFDGPNDARPRARPPKITSRKTAPTTGGAGSGLPLDKADGGRLRPYAVVSSETIQRSGFGVLARQNGAEEESGEDDPDSEPIRSPVTRRRRPAGFGMDGAGPDADGRGSHTRQVRPDSGSASMDESLSSRASSVKKSLVDERSSDDDDDEYVAVGNSVLDLLNVNNTELRRPKRIHFKNTANRNLKSAISETQKGAVDGYTAGFDRAWKAQERITDLMAAPQDFETSQLENAPSANVASRDASSMSSIPLPRRPAGGTSSLPASAPNLDDPLDEDAVAVAPKTSVTRTTLSGLSTAEVSADSSRRSSRRPVSRRSELEIDMRAQPVKTICDCCGGPMKGKGRLNWSMEVPGETDGDAMQEFCAECYEREHGEIGRPRTSLGEEGADRRVCCLCGSVEAQKWHYRLHKRDRFPEGKVCCKRCHDRDYRERMNPGSTTKRGSAAGKEGKDADRLDGWGKRGKRLRESSPGSEASRETARSLTASEKAALPAWLGSTEEGREILGAHILRKGLQDQNLHPNKDLATSSPAKSSPSPQPEDGQKEFRPKEKQEGAEKYDMGNLWRAVEAHGVAGGPSREEVGRCCRWSPDGRLLVVVGDFGIVSVYTRP